MADMGEDAIRASVSSSAHSDIVLLTALDRWLAITSARMDRPDDDLTDDDDALSALEAILSNTPAQGLDGVAVKLRCLLLVWSELSWPRACYASIDAPLRPGQCKPRPDTPERLTLGLLDDIQRMRAEA